MKQHEAFGDHEYYIKGDRRMWEVEFGIKHYAGSVIYKVQGFLDKNKDTQQDQLFEMMHNSVNVFVNDLTRFQVWQSVLLYYFYLRSYIMYNPKQAFITDL